MQPIVPVDLSQVTVFQRLAMKRAWTFERYFCPERSCDVDFTRLDALLRHCHNSHGESKKKSKAVGNSGATEGSSSKGKAAKGKRKESEFDGEEWMD